MLFRKPPPSLCSMSGSEDELDHEEEERQLDAKERDEFAKRLLEKDREKTLVFSDKKNKV